ncbi:MAG: hypothetical protein QMD36_03975 [Candidatus Aenigmarchaeota archaeon]|nr:hypothetical protein [Candidatus Aenigmarchaeota archaeon]
MLLQSSVQAISLGTTTEGTFSEVLRGETAKFTILLWNPENTSFPVKFNVVKAPKGLTVITNPKELKLNCSRVNTFPAEGGRHYVQTKQGLMTTTPIDVLVKVPRTFEPGEYDVYVNLVAGEITTGISTLLEKTLKFTVKVIAYRPELTTTTIKIEEKPIPIEKITGLVIKTFSNPRTIFIALLVIAILFVLWIIYKHG